MGSAAKVKLKVLVAFGFLPTVFVFALAMSANCDAARVDGRSSLNIEFARWQLNPCWLFAASGSDRAFGAPYPFTSRQLWVEILDLLKGTDGYITKEKVESAFRVVLKGEADATNKDAKFPAAFGVQQGRDWYFRMAVRSFNETESIFGLNLGQPTDGKFVPFPDPPPGMCINPDEVAGSVKQAGWDFIYHLDTRDIPPHDQYKKGQFGLLQIETDRGSHCILSVTIISGERLYKLYRE